MVLGDTMSILLKLKVDLGDLGKLARARRAIDRFERKMAGGRAAQYSQDLADLRDRMGAASQAGMTLGTSIEEINAMGIDTRKGVDELREKLGNVATAGKDVEGTLNNVNKQDTIDIFDRENRSGGVAQVRTARQDIARFSNFLRSSSTLGAVELLGRRMQSRLVPQYTRLSDGIAASRAKMSSFKQKAANTASTISQKLAGSLQAAQFAMLNLMFTGLNLAFVFGGILALSPRIRASFALLKAAFMGIATEAGEFLAPKLNKLARAIMNLDEDTKEQLGRLSVYGTILGVTAGIVGVLGGAVVTLISLMSKLKFGFVANTLVIKPLTKGAVMLAGALKTVLAGAAKSAGAALVKFAGVAKLALAKVAAVAGVSLAGITVPIGLAIAAILALGAAFKLGGGNIKKSLSSAFNTAKPLLNSLIETVQLLAENFLSQTGFMISAFGELVEHIVQPIQRAVAPAIKVLGAIAITVGHKLGDLFSFIMEKGKKALKKLAGFLVDMANTGINAFNDLIEGGTERLNFLIEKANQLKGINIGKIDPPKIGEAESALEGFNEKANNATESFAQVLAGDEARKDVKAFNDLADGMIDSTDEIGRGIQKVGDKMLETGEKIGNADITVDSLAEDVSNAKKALGEKASGLPDKLSGLLGGKEGEKGGLLSGLLGGGSGKGVKNDGILSMLQNGKGDSKGGLLGSLEKELGGAAGLMNGDSPGSQGINSDKFLGKETKPTKEEKNIENNVEVNVDELANDFDVDDLATDLADKMEREQKRTKNVL